MKLKKKCIITYARAWNGLAAARCLGHHGIEVISGDVLDVAAASFSKFTKEHFVYPDPDSDAEGFIDKLVQVAKRHASPDTDLVLMPLHSDAFKVAEYRDRFEGLAKMALPTPEQFELAGNKRMLASFCEEHGLHVPKTIHLDSIEKISAVAASVNYPAFVKLPEGAASIGLKKVWSAEEAVRTFTDFCSKYDVCDNENFPILQESVDGEDYCATYLFDHGEFRASMTYHNILCYPPRNGMGAVRETAEVPEIEALGRRTLELLGWHGVAEIDFRWDKKSEPYIIEINPRFWGGLVQSIESGWEYPYWLFQLAVDGHIGEVKPVRRYVKTWNPGLVLLLALEEFIDAGKDGHAVATVYDKLHPEHKKRQFDAIKQLVEGIENKLDPVDRLEAVMDVIKKSSGSLNEFFYADDPMPVLGLLYPLFIFLKHGSVSPQLLVGAVKFHMGENGTQKK